MGTGNLQRAALVEVDDIDDIDLDPIAFMQIIAGELIVFEEKEFVMIDLNGNVSSVRLHFLDNGCDDLTYLFLELLHHLAAFRFADALTDDVLGGLSGDAPEFLGVKMHDAGEADLGFGVIGERFIEQDLGFGDFNDVNDHFGDGYAEPTVFGVDNDGYVVGDLIIFFDGDNDCISDLFNQIIGLDAFFSFQHLKCFEELVIHFS